MPGFGAVAYGAAPYGGGGGAPSASASDSFTINDVASQTHALYPRASDSWSVTDSTGVGVAASDSFALSDVARGNYGGAGQAADSLTFGDAVRVYQAPFFDLPARLTISGGIAALEIGDGGPLRLKTASTTLQLKSVTRASTIKNVPVELTIEDVPVEAIVDG